MISDGLTTIKNSCKYILHEHVNLRKTDFFWRFLDPEKIDFK